VGKEPFYFKSYEKVVRVAHAVRELLRETRRLCVEDRACVEYHLREGHITQWLEYLGKGVSEGVEEREGRGLDHTYSRSSLTSHQPAPGYLLYIEKEEK
jgi:hypothetical protein